MHSVTGSCRKTIASRNISCVILHQHRRKRAPADSTLMAPIKANWITDEQFGQAGKVLPFRSLMSRIGWSVWKTL